MNIIVTSRHFKAHETLVGYARKSVGKLSRYYDGVIKGEVILSFEKKFKSVKIAEIILSVYRTKLTGVGRSEDFHQSIDAACEKLRAQLTKYKARLHMKDRNTVRRVREKV
jgi:ribosomal subunit interface protein